MKNNKLGLIASTCAVTALTTATVILSVKQEESIERCWLDAYVQSMTPITGEVIVETYMPASKRVPSIGSQYDLVVKLDNGQTINLSLIDDAPGDKENLVAIVTSGSRIGFPRGNLRDLVIEKFPPNCWIEHDDSTYRWPETDYKIGDADVIKHASRITVLPYK